MNLSYLFLSLVLLFSCTSPSHEERLGKERHKIVHQALGCFTKAMRAKGLNAGGVGEGVDHSTGKQKYLSVIFDVEELPDVEFTRKILVETIEKFLLCINSTEGIQDYLVEYPFTIQHIHIALISRNKGKGLCLAANSRGELYYDKDDLDKPIGPSIEVHRESYEDALRILAEQKTCIAASI